MSLATSIRAGSVKESDLRDWYWRGLISFREFQTFLSVLLTAQGVEL